MSAYENLYVAPGNYELVAGVIVYRGYDPAKREILLGLRGPNRAEPNKWALPTGRGAIVNDAKQVLAHHAPDSILKDPKPALKELNDRQRMAFDSPAGFALAEAQWYVDIPNTVLDKLEPFGSIILNNDHLLTKLLFKLKWADDADKPEPQNAAVSEWPFKETGFFDQSTIAEMAKIDRLAFECNRDFEGLFA